MKKSEDRPQMTETLQDLTGQVLLGKLRVVRKIGAGGAGHVYEVEHLVTHHRRALKVLQAHYTNSPTVLERFRREASVAGRLGSKYVVETYDADLLEDGSPYVLMELLDGQTLADRLDEVGVMHVGEACIIVEQTCVGLHQAHHAGIIHRDLKPDNLFLTRDGDGRLLVKILDFGISKFSTEDARTLTHQGALMGTPYYMSPEQVSGKKALDARADVYALGVILYEALSGERPFFGETLPEIFIKIHDGNFQPLDEHRPELASELVATVHKAMAREPADRFATAEELRSHLRRIRQSITSIDPQADTLASPTLGVSASRRPPNLRSEEEASSRARSSRWWWIFAPLLFAGGAVAAYSLMIESPSGADPTQPIAVPERIQPLIPLAPERDAVTDGGIAPIPIEPQEARPTVSHPIADPPAETRPTRELPPDRSRTPMRTTPSDSVGIDTDNPYGVL